MDYQNKNSSSPISYANQNDGVAANDVVPPLVDAVALLPDAVAPPITSFFINCESLPKQTLSAIVVFLVTGIGSFTSDNVSSFEAVDATQEVVEPYSFLHSIDDIPYALKQHGKVFMMAAEDLERDVPLIMKARVSEWCIPADKKKSNRSWMKYVSLWMSRKYSAFANTVEDILDKDAVQKAVVQHLSEVIFIQGTVTATPDFLVGLDTATLCQVIEESQRLTKGKNAKALSLSESKDSVITEKNDTIADLQTRMAELAVEVPEAVFVPDAAAWTELVARATCTDHQKELAHAEFARLQAELQQKQLELAAKKKSLEDTNARISKVEDDMFEAGHQELLYDPLHNLPKSLSAPLKLIRKKVLVTEAALGIDEKLLAESMEKLDCTKSKAEAWSGWNALEY